MASNLAGGACLGQFRACLLRIAKLNSDCTPAGGADNKVITSALVTMTMTPNVTEGKVYESRSGCGARNFRVRGQDTVDQLDLTGQLSFFDYEMMKMLFGGELILGDVGTPYAGKVIGWSAPAGDTTTSALVALEVVVQNATGEGGDCINTTESPAYTGHWFPRAQLRYNDRTFEDEVANLTFTGYSVSNPNLHDPFGDWPGATPTPTTSPYFMVGYAALPDTPACGFQTVAVAS